MATDINQYFGFTDPSTSAGDFNQQRFVIQQQMMNLNTSMPVIVRAVRATGIAPVGYVDIQILVDQITGNDKTVPHGVIPNVPYFRIQGGNKAIIIDPEVGDIGMACFCSRDISSVKNARKNAPPGSRRTYDISDALYVGGFLNKAPTHYIQFTNSGILVHTPGTATIEAPNIVLNGNVNVNGTLKNNGVNVGSTHSHPGVQAGGSSTGTPQ